jgi:hypothetical protein
VALILDESKWLTVAMGAAFLTVAFTLYRQRHIASAPEAATLSAMTLGFAVTIGVMACGHLLAVTLELLSGTLVGSAPLLSAIGVGLAVPSGWLLVHALRTFGRIHGSSTLILNGWLTVTQRRWAFRTCPLRFRVCSTWRIRSAVGAACGGRLPGRP